MQKNQTIQINAYDHSIHSDDNTFLFYHQNGSALLELVLDSINRRATVAQPTRNPISENRGKSKKIGSALLELVPDSISRRATVAPPTRNPISESRGKSKKIFRNCF
ncbi:hypothetical protein CEXT_780461 [Caerostris extrusa]|uniref:Uncharacterized protein n=1 Tax=Caerostris extrusa TaxID=172846 RepID=A0AAV4WUK2_CAEEX|nr:hypothetical protein CEXT_780461 [Caerostris extrusa]